MKFTRFYITWAVLYALSAGLGFIYAPTGAALWLCMLVSILFFLPPAAILYFAAPRERLWEIRLVRNLSILSLVLTLGALIGNILSVGGSKLAGEVAYVLLILVSAPMICGRIWLLSLFLWSCLLVVSITMIRKIKKSQQTQ